jgi:hypothetical protein
MKKITYILLLIFLSNCSSRTSKTPATNVSEPFADCALSGQKLETEKDIEKKYNIKLNFSILETIEYDINGIKGKVIIEKIDDWNDPGDFHRIRIVNDSCFSFFNVYGWVKTRTSILEYVPNFTTYNKSRSDYIVLSKNGNDLLLFVFGYVYASQPGLLSIVNLSLKEPKLLFNDNCMLSGYQENKPNIVVTGFFKEDNINKHDTLLLKDHCLHKL